MGKSGVVLSDCFVTVCLGIDGGGGRAKVFKSVLFLWPLMRGESCLVLCIRDKGFRVGIPSGVKRW